MTPEKLELLKQPMLTCEQFPGMNVYEHGVSVNEWFNRLRYFTNYADCAANTPVIPAWLPKILDQITQDEETIRLYQTYHDCGKPFCRVVDEQGRQHFPDHAQASYDTWMKFAETPQDEKIGQLILHDMDAHTAKGEAIGEFTRRPDAALLIATGLAEVYSNATAKGQVGSDQFKIKMKQLDKVAKRFLASKEVVTTV